MALISVIIPCYNASKHIGRCIQALENQSFRDFDVVFIDDCSSDNTVETIKSVCKSTTFPFAILKNDINMGPAASRNKGICYTKSEYITFCDSDDWYDRDFMLVLYTNLVKHNSSLVFCGHKVVNAAGDIELRPLVDTDTICDTNEALLLNADSLCMMMVKSSIMKNTLLPTIRNGEDMAVTPLLMLKANGCVALSNVLYNYYRRSDSASQSPTTVVVDSLIESFQYIIDNIPIGYYGELEYIGIRNLLYSGLITLMSFSYDKNKGNEIINWFESIFPNWEANPYINNLPKYKRLFLSCVHKRLFISMRAIAIIRIIATRSHNET